LQGRLLEHLAAKDTPEAIRAALLADPHLAPFRDWLEQFELRFIEVAALLVAKWGRRA
jgi:hypothetical protein